jgi:hypothetical protein
MAAQGMQVGHRASDRVARKSKPQLVASASGQEPLVDRILNEIVALKAERDRGGHSLARERELIVQYDEAFGEIQRARTMAKAAEQRHGD